MLVWLALLTFVVSASQEYQLLDSGQSCESEGYFYITSVSDCSRAGVQLNMVDTSASSDGQNGASWDPPYCYYEGGTLKFGGSSNYGACTTYDRCLCSITGITSGCNDILSEDDCNAIHQCGYVGGECLHCITDIPWVSSSSFDDATMTFDSVVSGVAKITFSGNHPYQPVYHMHGQSDGTLYIYETNSNTLLQSFPIPSGVHKLFSSVEVTLAQSMDVYGLRIAITDSGMAHYSQFLMMHFHTCGDSLLDDTDASATSNIECSNDWVESPGCGGGSQWLGLDGSMSKTDTTACGALCSELDLPGCCVVSDAYGCWFMLNGYSGSGGSWNVFSTDCALATGSGRRNLNETNPASKKYETAVQKEIKPISSLLHKK